MRRQVFINCISDQDFKRLFITELGWNQVRGQAVLPSISVEDKEYFFSIVAIRNGFKVLVCNTDFIPSLSVCKRIDTKLRRYAFDYICVFCQNNTIHHQWVAPIVKLGKRTLVSIEYESITQTTFLFSKIGGLSFRIDEETTIRDIKDRVQSTFEINSERITKDFYRGFKVVLNSFASHISGLEDATPVSSNRWKQWYASIMLNRLMFCYFIQKKGFLDGNVNYLVDKLNWVRFQKGINQFYGSFYKGFLRSLFQDGLDSPNRDARFFALFGKIPYVNGGLFASHLVEQKYPGMDIDDEAFIELFSFFDNWEWHLDTRLSASGRDINPDVLGYIFEQYINDKSKMGAYYTQEDITEFISRNCIIPSFLNSLFESPFKDTFISRINSLFGHDPERYIYDSVKYGYNRNWKSGLPHDISIGLEKEVLSAREKWNDRTPNSVGLPTETWRDTISRFKKCDSIIESSNQPLKIEDIISKNINGRLLCVDLISRCESDQELAFLYNSLSSLKVLDPACGSGAFLFAAMNVLETLYEECFVQMSRFHESDNNLFIEELNKIGTNDKYVDFNVCSLIASNNIYGVDIMPEAIEIAKLRLFLRIVSTLEVDLKEQNNGLKTLPDIDFNILCGNSLTGSSSFRDVTELTEELDSISKSIQAYKSSLFTKPNHASSQTDKNAIIASIQRADTFINGKLRNDAREYAWLDGHAPLNWSIRFYDIIRDGGFHTIIGNPPYRENRDLDYCLNGYSTVSCGNVYTCMLERGFDLLRPHGYIGMIVQLSIVCTDRMAQAQKMLKERMTWLYNFDDRPGKLFENLQHIRATVVLSTDSSQKTYTSRYYRWFTEFRPFLFDGINVVPELEITGYNSIPKIGDDIARSIMRKIIPNRTISAEVCRNGNYPMYYHNAPLYFTRGTNFLPYFRNSSGDTVSSCVKHLCFRTKEVRDICSAVLNSSLFYMWNVTLSDNRHLSPREIKSFPLGLDHMSKEDRARLVELCSTLMTDLIANKIRKITNGERNGFNEYDEFKPKPSKPIMDEIDCVLAKHFSLTQEEQDYIINYDYKFRMGDSSEE